MKRFPKARLAVGFDWFNWNIGLDFIKADKFGFLITFTVFPFKVIYLAKKYDQ